MYPMQCHVLVWARSMSYPAYFLKVGIGDIIQGTSSVTKVVHNFAFTKQEKKLNNWMKCKKDIKVSRKRKLWG